ncbi:MAG: porin, partial [Pseudomonadota bacterium]|nr:porin [Pseudomonadota bacterium]
GDEPELSGDQTHALAGKSWLLGTDWVYQYDSAKSQGQGDLHIQAEYLYQVKDLDLMYHASKPELVGAQREFSQDGFYLQAVYGLAPRIEAGLRYDVVGLTNELEGPNATLKDWDTSQRWGLMLAFRPTEYSILRAQFSRTDFSIEDNSEAVNQFWLQYQLSLGVHGAHTF